MLAVDRQERRAARRGGLGHQRARRDQGFLVGERHGPAGFDRRHVGSRPAQPTIAAMTSRLARRRFDQRLLARGRAAIGALKRRLELWEPAFVGDHRELGAGPAGSIGERLDVRRRGECGDLEPLRRSLDQVERRLADRAGGAEDGDLVSRQPSQLRRERQHRDRNQAIEPIEDAAMARSRCRILDPGAALHPAFEQVAAPARLQQAAAQGRATAWSRPIAQRPGAAEQGRRDDAAAQARQPSCPG